MIQPDRIENSEEIGLDKTDKSKDFRICHCNYYDHGLKSHSKNRNRCDWEIKSFGTFAIIHVNNFRSRFFMFDLTEEDAIEFIKNFEPYDESETSFQHERIDISEGLTLTKQVYQDNVCFVIIGTLKMLGLNLSHVYVVSIILDVSFQNN